MGWSWSLLREKQEARTISTAISDIPTYGFSLCQLARCTMLSTLLLTGTCICIVRARNSYCIFTKLLQHGAAICQVAYWQHFVDLLSQLVLRALQPAVKCITYRTNNV